jgi:nitric oxide reductase NorD protein
VYDEWDDGNKRYKQGHCRVREQLAEAALDGSFFADTLARQAAVAARLKRQFESTAATLLRKQTRQFDGDELDLDAAIEASVERRAGRTPSGAVYVRRQRRERDVALAVLLDTSSSTADPVDASASGPGAARVLDVAKQALVMLCVALDALGDRYAIYSFSGYGREQVELRVIKALGEPRSPAVERRIGGIRADGATRMGPAIRHVTHALRNAQASSRHLLLISDGRPQDRGYGSSGTSQSYAVQDTRKAVLSARACGVKTFCLAIDKAGHDYLATMMGGHGHQLLWDVTMLPERLPALYRGLTA